MYVHWSHSFHIIHVEYWTVTGFHLAVTLQNVNILISSTEVSTEKFPPFGRWMWKQSSNVKLCTYIILQTSKWSNNKQNTFLSRMGLNWKFVSTEKLISFLSFSFSTVSTFFFRRFSLYHSSQLYCRLYTSIVFVPWWGNVSWALSARQTISAFQE